MMRKALALLLLTAIFTLAGCYHSALYPTTDPTGQISTIPPTTQQMLPLRELYLPNSSMEMQTNGAVLCYEPDPGEHQMLAQMGEDVLLVSTTGTDGGTVILTRITGANGGVKCQTRISCDTALFMRTLQVSSDALGYYDENNGCVVMLNGLLQETKRVVLPSNRIGAPAISPDLRMIYYSTATEVRALDVQTESARLLREHSYPELIMGSVCFDDGQLLCYVTEEDFDKYAAFISTKNGAITATDSQMLSFEGSGNRFFLNRREGSVQEYLYGDYGQQVREFYPRQQGRCYWLPVSESVVVASEMANGEFTLDGYDLAGGLRNATTVLSGIAACDNFVSGSEEGIVWFLTYDSENGKEYLCRWDMSMSPVADQAQYTSVHYTADNPDVDRLTYCGMLAQRLADKYSVEITFLEAEMVNPPEYTLEAEFQARAIETGLTTLEKALSLFPESFVARLADMSADGLIHIQLVRSISGDPVGLQYWLDGNSYVALELGDTLEQSFFHELYHVMDSYLIGNSGYLDRWDDNNPKSFDYLYDYSGFEALKDSKYLSGDEQAFIDAYSMTYPKEDRARIFEYALMEGNEEIFFSKTMQSKLSLLCTAIRDAFDLEENFRFRWEEYLGG